ncbi:hypothetical protein LOK49_LG09G01973 [Camellia lanceoleosa]|uniref:Uncharacterized protein n=1 Tax=Camellia lanceoleosa TaxID=1840588 RepID=A0ACC0GKJ8_9ERIC|nr:hypothetical protein LOK49_LG09G01973 [Camellia lanceoleosa]
MNGSSIHIHPQTTPHSITITIRNVHAPTQRWLSETITLISSNGIESLVTSAVEQVMETMHAPVYSVRETTTLSPSAFSSDSSPPVLLSGDSSSLTS